MAADPAFQCKLTCHQRPPFLRDHIFMANGVVFQDRLDRFYGTSIASSLISPLILLRYIGLKLAFHTRVMRQWHQSSSVRNKIRMSSI